jgi:catechol 2,3-dioxygenase-like lactoylglutathione lyase family enzyme
LGKFVIDHFNLPVSDLTRSRLFYESVLVPLGARFVAQDGAAVGFGINNWSFGVVLAPLPITKLHLAFGAQSRRSVDAFFETALANGAVANGSPGVRCQYDPNYYAAYVLDPDGHNVEAVCRGAGRQST